MQRGARADSSVAVLLALCVLLGSGFGTGCADPIKAYHRQFDYLIRVGNEALAEGRLDEAHDWLREAAQLAKISAATDVEYLDVLTRLTEATRGRGDLREARSHAATASQVLERQRLPDGSLSSDAREVAGDYLLERARLETELGDLVAAEEALDEFFVLRGAGERTLSLFGPDQRESAESRWLKGELLLARGAANEARLAFREALGPTGKLDEERDAELVGFILLRGAEGELSTARVEPARALIERSRPDGIASPALRPGLLLTLGLVDVAERNSDRARIRLGEGLAGMVGEDSVASSDVASPARAIRLASMIYDPEDSVQQLGDVVDRALAAAGEGSPLRAVHAGRAAVALGRELFAKSEYGAGIQAMTRARKAIATAVRNRPHDSLVEAEFELASLLYRLGRAELASPHCSALLAASPHLSDQARELHPRRLLSCGFFEAHHGGVAEARALYSRALMVGSQVSLGPDLQTELLLRLAALAHLEVRDSEEEKLFERVLPLVGPSDYPRLKELLIDAYAPLGSMQPSSAAARLAYVAARLPDYHAQASPLHSIAERLSTLPPPASR